MQVQAKALADPSRFRLFRHIVEVDGPVRVADLTELLGFNHNAIRQHLAILVDAGLVAETDEVRTSVGRPRKEYTARQDGLRAFRSVSGSYERLAGLLLQVITSGRRPYEIGRLAAEAGRDTKPSAADDLMQRLTADGFEPVRTADDTVTLGHCPFADVAAQSPDVVCELHQGLLDGLLASAEPQLHAELDARDPRLAGCVVTVRPGRSADDPD